MTGNETDFFEVAFRSGPLKTGTISLTLFFAVILSAAGYGFIWFEKFGSDKKRTLVNRFNLGFSTFSRLVHSGRAHNL